MNWDGVAAMAELLGAIAVVVSLIYLGRQVRQNTTAVRTGNATSMQNNFQALAKLFYTDSEMETVDQWFTEEPPIRMPHLLSKDGIDH